MASFSSKTIVLPVGSGIGDHESFYLACSLAKQSRGMVYAIYVIEVGREFPVDAEVSEEVSRGESILEEIELLAHQEKCSLEANILQARRAGPAILKEAYEKHADIIVLGTGYNRSMGNFYMNDMASYILQHSRCPVLLWRQGMPESISVGG